MSPSPHAWAREVLLRAWPGVTGAEPTLPELQLAGAVANLETHYGAGWQGPGEGSNNWGAVKCAAMPPCPDTCFPNKDYPDTLYCFRRYATPEAGASHTIKLLTVNRPTVWRAMRDGDISRVAREMSRTRYFQADPVAYARGLSLGVGAIAAANGEERAAWLDGELPAPTTPAPQPATTGQPSRGSRLVALVAGAALGYGAVRVLA